MRGWASIGVVACSGCLAPNSAYDGTAGDSGASSTGLPDTGAADTGGPGGELETASDDGPDSTTDATTGNTSAPMVTSDVTTVPDDGSADVVFPDTWWDESWPFRQKVAFNRSIDGAQFWLPVRVDVGPLPGPDPAGDVRFVTDRFEVLNHSLEHWGNDDALAWVEMPLFGDGETPRVWMYFGGQDAFETPVGAFDLDYLGVWHLADNVDDSSNELTLEGDFGSSAGPVGAAAEILDANSLRAPPSDALNDLPLMGLTFSTWVRFDDGAPAAVLYSKQASMDGPGLEIGIDPEARITVSRSFTPGDAPSVITSVEPIPAGDWVHLTVEYSPEEQALYFNGEVATTEGIIEDPGVSESDAEAQLTFAGHAYEGGVNEFFGALDEIRLSPFVEGVEWVRMSYQAQLPSFVDLDPVEMFAG